MAKIHHHAAKRTNINCIIPMPTTSFEIFYNLPNNFLTNLFRLESEENTKIAASKVSIILITSQPVINKSRPFSQNYFNC